MYLSYNSPDSQLVSDYIQGNEQSLELLVFKHKTKIYNFIFSKVLNTDLAEDIFQETFIKVIKTLKNGLYNEEGKFLSWVLRISHNLIIDHYRKSNRIPIFEGKDDYDIFQFIVDSSPSAETDLVNNQIFDDLKKLIIRLPKDQKEVLNMRLYKEISFNLIV